MKYRNKIRKWGYLIVFALSDVFLCGLYNIHLTVIALLSRYYHFFLNNYRTYVRAGCCPCVGSARESLLEELCSRREGGGRAGGEVQRGL